MKIVPRSLLDTLIKSEQFVTAVVRLASTTIVVAGVLLLFQKYHGPIEDFLRSHPPTSVEGFGVKIGFEAAAKELDHLQNKPASPQEKETFIPLTDDGKAQIKERIKVIGPLLAGRKILWVDDHPENQIPERAFLHALGIAIDTAQSSKAAYKLYGCQQLNGTPYDLVVSDVNRDLPDTESGFTMGGAILQKDRAARLLFYTAEAKLWYQNPPHYPVVAITNHTQELFNKIFDVMEFSVTKRQVSGPSMAIEWCQP